MYLAKRAALQNEAPPRGRICFNEVIPQTQFVDQRHRVGGAIEKSIRPPLDDESVFDDGTGVPAGLIGRVEHRQVDVEPALLRLFAQRECGDEAGDAATGHDDAWRGHTVRLKTGLGPPVRRARYLSKTMQMLRTNMRPVA